MSEPAKKPQRFDRSIVEGPLVPAVWRLAWPTMLQNVIAGLQGIIDHAMVGHYWGYTANAAIGVSWQVILVLIVFISSLFTGMAVLVARFAGANETEKVNRVVYQAFLTALGLAAIMAVVGYAAAPALLDVGNAAPAVQAQALPFLRGMFIGIIGMMMFFMLSRALGAAAARRHDDGPHHRLQRAAHPAAGDRRRGVRHHRQHLDRLDLRPDAVLRAELGDPLPPRHGPEAGLDHRALAVPLRAADRLPGHRDEHRRRHAAALDRLDGGARGRGGPLTRRLHRALLAHHLDLGGADGGIGHHRRTEPRRRQAG